MARFSRVPVMTVNKDNFDELWPGMVKAVENSSFIAMDCVSLPIYTIHLQPGVSSVRGSAHPPCL